jgi:hypothetical protein
MREYTSEEARKIDKPVKMKEQRVKGTRETNRWRTKKMM